MFDFTNKVMTVVVVLWILALIALGVTTHYAEKDIERQKHQGGGPG